MSSETVPIFGFGIRPLGPSIFPNFPILDIIEGVQMSFSKFSSPDSIGMDLDEDILDGKCADSSLTDITSNII